MQVLGDNTVRAANPPTLSAPLAPPREPTGRHLLRFFRFERRWLLRVFETILPAGEKGAAGAAPVLGAPDVPMGGFVDDLLTHAPLLSVVGLRAALWMVMLAPPVVLRRACSFLGLATSERIRLLDSLGRSRLYIVRESALLLKIMACLGFCGLAPVQQRVGIHPVDAIPPSWARPE